MLAFRPATPDAVASRPAAGVTAPGAPPVTPERSAAAKTAPAGRAAGRGPIPVAPERSAARPVEAGPEAPAPAPGGPAPVGAEPARTESPDWSALVELAANAALLGQDGDTVRLSLAPGHAQMRSRAREAQIEEALGRWYGTPVRLVIEVGEPAAETPAQRARRLAAERRASAARALDQDPTVQRLRDTFDATLVDTSIRSVDPGDAEAEVDSGLPH
jgi:DNA polymerase-3 subunit gamma/tau